MPIIVIGVSTEPFKFSDNISGKINQNLANLANPTKLVYASIRSYLELTSQDFWHQLLCCCVIDAILPIPLLIFYSVNYKMDLRSSLFLAITVILALVSTGM